MDEDDIMDEDFTQPYRYQPQHYHEPQFEAMSEPAGKMLDLVFIQDATGSMGSYIASATKNIEEICAAIINSEKLSREDDLRVSIIAYRDHPPQDHSYVTKVLPFTSSIPSVKEFLGSLYASGGGDGPEAVTAGMSVALDGVEWRQDAAKMVVLVADAPPHGIGEYGDGFPNGSPDGKDPLQLAREMASRGITMFIVACEPALSGYLYGNDLFKAICSITSGIMLPLTTASLLAHAIVGSALEHIQMDRLIKEVGQAVGERLRGGSESVDDIARELHERLMLRNESTKKLVIENIYKESEEASHNVEVFIAAPDIGAAKPYLKKVQGSRFTDSYLASRYTRNSYSTSSTYKYAPAVPPRPVSSTTGTTSTVPATPSSPPSRQVLSSFKAFGASPPTGVFGAPVLGSSFGSSAGALRGGAKAADDSDDDETPSAGQRIGFEEGAISLDQAKRIAMGAAWRSRG